MGGYSSLKDKIMFFFCNAENGGEYYSTVLVCEWFLRLYAHITGTADEHWHTRRRRRSESVFLQTSNRGTDERTEWWLAGWMTTGIHPSSSSEHVVLLCTLPLLLNLPTQRHRVVREGYNIISEGYNVKSEEAQQLESSASLLFLSFVFYPSSVRGRFQLPLHQGFEPLYYLFLCKITFYVEL